jgi:hypothetical protein
MIMQQNVLLKIIRLSYRVLPLKQARAAHWNNRLVEQFYRFKTWPLPMTQPDGRINVVALEVNQTQAG